MRRARMISWMLPATVMACVIFWPGCKKNDSTTGPGEGSSGVITVTGKAVGLNLQPLQHFPVVIAGRPATVSDDSGSFTITGVQTPYTVTVIDPSNTSALVYVGLSRTDLTLVWLSKSPGVVCNGALNGTVSGGGFAPSQEANDQTEILFLTPGTSATTSIDGALSGDFGMGATWFGPTTTTGSLFALQFTRDPATGFPAAGGFKAFGSATGVSMVDGQTKTGQALALQALTPSQTGRFTATIDVPAGFTVDSKSLFLRPDANGLVPILDDATPATSISYFAPVVTSATLTVRVQISDGRGSVAQVLKSGMTAGGTTQAVAAQAPPELSLPVIDASSVDTTTEFSWKPFANGVHYVVFLPATTGNPSFEVVTTAQSCRLPNLKAYGLTLPKGATYRWGIEAFGPVASVNEAADRGLFRMLRRPGEITTTAVFGGTPLRQFRTAP